MATKKVVKEKTVKPKKVAVEKVVEEIINSTPEEQELCPTCGGIGRIPQHVAWHNVSCHVCDGTGKK